MRLFGVGLALLLLAAHARAAIIEVGPNRPITTPSAALKSAQEGDTIAIDAGEYFDCMNITTAGLTVAGTGDGAVLTDTTCNGKAIIIAAADRITLRNLTLRRARVPDGNGAGIRAAGKDLTIAQVKFSNDQAGLLAGPVPGSTVTITDSEFDTTGRCTEGRCAAALQADGIGRLRIERTRFVNTAGAHEIVSAADSTEIIGCAIGDGPTGSASLQLYLPAGGSLLLEDNTFQKGPHSSNLRAAILIDGEITGSLTIRRNRFINETAQPVPFIINWSDTAPSLDGNTTQPAGIEIASDGYFSHRAGTLARDAVQAARQAAGLGRRALGKLLGH